MLCKHSFIIHLSLGQILQWTLNFKTIRTQTPSKQHPYVPFPSTCICYKRIKITVPKTILQHVHARFGFYFPSAHDPYPQ